MGRLTSGMKRLAAVAAVAMLPAALGCGAFFQCEGKASCGSSSGGTDGGDVVFAANQGSTGIYTYYISSGKMYTVTGEPFSTSFVTTSMVVNTANTYLFAATTTGYIYSYAVSTTGVLSGLQQATITQAAQVSMDVSSDGKWLAALDNSATPVPTLKIYSISGGTLSLTQNAVPLLSSTATVTPTQVKFSPNNDYVAVVLSSAGTYIYPFVSSTAVGGAPLNTTGSIQVAAGTGDNAIAWDASENLYIGRSTGVPATTGVYELSKADITNANPTLHFGLTDSGPRALVFADSSGYLYSASTANSTINGFSVANGVMTSLGTSTGAPTAVDALAVDSTGLNLLAAGTSNTGLQLYTLSSGALSESNNAATGTTGGAPVLAVTH